MNDKEFIELLSKEIDSIPDFPVLKSLAISQACLESAFGKKHFYNNLFGIKCRNPKKYAGCRIGKTQEYISGSYGNYKLAFQCYNSFRESLEDYAGLMRLARYKPVREAKDYLEATDEIRKCGYATSPTYTTNLRNIIEKYKLYEKEDHKMDKNLQLTKSFKWGEFWSNNFGKPKVEPPQEYFDNIYRIAFELQKVRDRLNQDFNPKKEIQIVITSGWRTKEWNASKDVEGAKNSKHLYGLAADSRAIGVPLLVYYTYICRYTSLNHLGYYPAPNLNFVHAGIEDNLVIFKY